MEEELRKECARLQTVNAALQSEMILKHAPLEALHAVRADKLAADAALACLGECVRGWAKRRGDAVPSELLQAPSNAEQVSALFEYIKSGSRRHLSAACSPKQTAVGNASSSPVGPWPSPAASPVIDDTHVAGLRAQLVELEVRLKTQCAEHEQELSAATVAKERELQSLRDELAYKEQQLAEMPKLEAAKVDAERRADEMATKHAHAVASVEELQGQLRTKEAEVLQAAAAVASLRSARESQDARSAELLQRLDQLEQQKGELAEQREIMQRALESSQKHAEQAQRKTETLQQQLQQREAIYMQIASRVENNEHDRATLKSRLDAVANTLAGLESKQAELSRRTTSVTSQLTAEDDSQTTQAVNGDSQQSEGSPVQMQQSEESPAQVQLLSASSPGPLKPQPTGVKNMRKRAASPGASQSGKQVVRHSSQSDDTAARSPAAALQAVPQTPQCGTEPEQTTASPANPVPSEPEPNESKKKRRATVDGSDKDEPKPKVAMLSGFSSKESLHELEQQLEEMGVKIKRGNAFDKTITHVVAPAGQNTWKTIAGALAQRWVVHDGWVRDSYHAFKQQRSTMHTGSTAQESPHFFVDENRYGNKKETRIFNKKHFAFSGAFITQHANKVTLMKSVVAFGGGKVLSATKSWEAHALDDRGRVTHLFVSDMEAAEKARADSNGIVAVAGSTGVESLTYDEFVQWIGVWRRSDSPAAKRARRDSVQSSPQMATKV